MKLIPFFRAGTHTTTSGHDLTFSEGDVSTIADVYDPDVYEAPLVVGHPEMDSPAYGWAESVREENGLLAAVPRDVEPQFEEMVEDGRFEKVSAKFYPPGHPQHPLGDESDVFYLRHIGFLGAKAPAIKGLPNVEFGDEGDELVEVEVSFAEADGPAFAEMPSWFPQTVRDVFRRVREYLVETEDVETADQVVPAWTLDELERVEDQAQGEDVEPAYAQHTDDDSQSDQLPTDTMNFLDALLRVQLGKMLRGSDKTRAEVVQELADAADVNSRTINKDLSGDTEKVPEERLQVYSDVLGIDMDELMMAKGEDMDGAEFAEASPAVREKMKELRQREKELEEREREQQREQVTAFVEEHIGTVTPGHKETVVEALLHLDQQEDVQVQFGEGEDAEEKPVGEAMRSFIEALPKQIEFSEVSGEDEDEKEKRPEDDSEYARKLSKRAVEYAEEHDCSIDEAVTEVRTEFEPESLD